MPVQTAFCFALTYVADVPAATHFFVDRLGLSVEREFPTFVQFTDGAGARFAITSDPPFGNGAPELYWVVDDVAAAYRELAQSEPITLPLAEQPYGTLFGVADPSGQTHYLLTFAQSRPSSPAMAASAE